MFKPSTLALEDEGSVQVDEPAVEEGAPEATEESHIEPEIDLESILSSHGDALREKLLGDYKQTIKVNGSEREMSLEDLIMHASKSSAADEKFKTAAQQRKEAEEMMKQIEASKNKDIYDLFKERGLGEDDLVTMFQKLQDEQQLTPEQKRLQELEAQLAEIENQKKQRQVEEEEAKAKAEADEYYSQLENELATELNKSNLPKDSFILAQVAHQLEIAGQMGYDMPVSEAVKTVEESLMSNVLPQLIGLLSDDRKRSVLGEDFVKQLMDSQVNEAKKSQQALKQPKRNSRPSSKPAASKEEPPARLSMDDF